MRKKDLWTTRPEDQRTRLTKQDQRTRGLEEWRTRGPVNIISIISIISVIIIVISIITISGT